MLNRDNLKLFREHQIEELLLNAHFECESGIDLIDEYFAVESSLDLITQYAEKLLSEISDSQTRAAILRNLSDCIIVKSQYEKKSLIGKIKKSLAKVGIDFGKNREIRRAEALIHTAHSLNGSFGATDIN
ncbi:MAG: hypothetical protein JSS30_02060 [Verrucomicrobia bacterium]|nr:hypothetical protein [Verrucomicrobiota bacterium]